MKRIAVLLRSLADRIDPPPTFPSSWERVPQFDFDYGDGGYAIEWDSPGPEWVVKG